jgi:hypothetical protein
MKREKLWQEFMSLSPELQQQVMDFIVFLRTRQTPIGTSKPVKRSDLADEPFIGMWRKRKDLHDSTAWVRKTRDREWMSHDG